MGILDRILRAGEGKKLRALDGLVPEIRALQPVMKALSDEALQGKTAEFRQRLDRGATLDDLLIEAFAVTREAAWRVIGQEHFEVQLTGGAALHFGWVAEMKTGEGKTLVSTLPVYLNALAGKGVHLVTVNDYLARFHAEWMGRIHNFLGLSVGLIIPGYRESAAEKRLAYAADVTYGTNNEFGFDYLRDNMAATLADKVQRGHSYAIIDEVDSILIDEARTPLIISGRIADAAKLYYQFAQIVNRLRRDEDYEVEEDKRVVVPLEAGIDKVEAALGINNLYDEVQQNLVHQLGAALKAKELYKRDKDYIVQNGEVKIVDEFTGRILEGRRWSEGIHQAVEAKERLQIKEENQTLATITLQNYFRMYDKLAGMTGTAQTEAAELMNTYNLAVVQIKTNQPVARIDEADLIYKSELAKFESVADDIAEKYERGQPVLVGTISVEKSEHLSRELHKRGITHEVLNAKQHTREAHIVAQAGRLHAVTVATNMAGRGVDIKLGGDPEGLARQAVITEGFTPDLLIDEFELPLPLAEMDEEYRTNRAAAQARYDQLLAEYAVRCKAEGDDVRRQGGLYVLGTERHDSRRIDNQLRGRSGRQGDPGESRFYLSLDDELMRLFATGALSWVMGRALPDDEAIEAKMVTKAIERAQTTVEQRNGEIRKNVLKYDEVMNEQRKVIYQRRDQILEGMDLKTAAMDYLAEAVNALLESYCQSASDDEWDLDGLTKELKTFWPNDITVEQLERKRNSDDIYDMVMADASAFYDKRESELGAATMRDVERQVMLRIIDQRWREHLEEMDYLQEGINLRAMGQIDPLVAWQKEGFEMFGAMMKGIAQDFVRYVMHVQVIRNEAPAPIVERVTQTSSDDSQVDGFASAAQAAAASGELEPEVAAGASRAAAARATEAAPVKQQTIVKDEWSRTPRNAPCPCGSGKKFKLCRARGVRDFSDQLAELRRRLGEAHGYLKIDANRSRLSELEMEVGRPDLWDDQELAKKINTEYAAVRGDVEVYDGLEQELDDVELLHEMAREVDDESQEPDIDTAIASIGAALDELDLRSLFTGEHDEADCIVQINAKDGGVDAQDWSEILLRMYGRWAERRKFGFEVDGISEGTEAGILSAEFTITGRYAYGLMTSERGTHRLVRISPFDNQGRRQTSFAAVQVWPVMDDPDVEINEADIRMEVFRASGAGGQHVNKTSSAVRLIHEPTGLVASSQEERSQLQNREKALTRLRAMVAAKVEEEHQAELDRIAGRQAQVGWGSQIRSYVVQPYQMVKDLRTEVESNNIAGVLDGDVDEFMVGYLQWRRREAE